MNDLYHLPTGRCLRPNRWWPPDTDSEKELAESFRKKFKELKERHKTKTPASSSVPMPSLEFKKDPNIQMELSPEEVQEALAKGWWGHTAEEIKSQQHKFQCAAYQGIVGVKELAGCIVKFQHYVVQRGAWGLKPVGPEPKLDEVLVNRWKRLWDLVYAELDRRSVR